MQSAKWTYVQYMHVHYCAEVELNQCRVQYTTQYQLMIHVNVKSVKMQFVINEKCNMTHSQ